MAKRWPEHRYSRRSGSQKNGPNKTAAGVWVIVGMALFFVAGGLGISAFILAKALAGDKAASASNDAATGNVEPAATGGEAADAGADHSKPGPPAVNTVSLLPRPSTDLDEEERTRREVLVRIDLLRSLTNNEKDKLYAQVERAQGFKKIANIPFSENSAVAAETQIDGLIKNLREPSLQELLSDPTVVLIVVGYADRHGDERKNLEISKDRAESVVKALSEKMDLANVVHAVGMGGQDLFDQTDAKKNCVVEVWAAQP
jgi:outer membrane protein OmpA-like peptidoglycan-associated protein